MGTENQEASLFYTSSDLLFISNAMRLHYVA